MPPPGLDALDAELSRLRSACGTVSVTLVELDTDATWRLLQTASVTGRTAERRQLAEAGMATLWFSHRQLAQLIADADTARAALGRDPDGTRRAGLAELVFGESIELTNEAVPLADRTLFGPSQVSTRCTPAAVLTACEQAFDRVRSVLTEVAAAWRWQLDRLDQCSSELAALRPSGLLARDLERTAAALGELSARIESDPLAVTDADFAPIEHGLARARESGVSAAELRARIDTVVAEGPERLAELDRRQREAADAHAAAVTKIAYHPQAPPAAVDVAALAGRLTELTAAARSEQWPAAAPAVQVWERAVTAALDRAVADLQRARQPLADRSELRGRLDAYRAKAAAYGLAEQAQLSRMGARARDLLYVSPCDLRAARAAVNAYTNAVVAATAPTVSGDSR